MEEWRNEELYKGVVGWENMNIDKKVKPTTKERTKQTPSVLINRECMYKKAKRKASRKERRTLTRER